MRRGPSLPIVQGAVPARLVLARVRVAPSLGLSLSLTSLSLTSAIPPGVRWLGLWRGTGLWCCWFILRGRSGLLRRGPVLGQRAWSVVKVFE